MHSYATYFDSNYLPRALSLFESLRRNGDESEIFALLLDEAAETFFASQTTNVRLITLNELETRFPELLKVKPTRSKMEYIFTLTPWLMKFVAEESNGDLVIYLDSDLYFFNEPQLVVAEMGSSDIGIIEHKYPKFLQKQLNKYGKFNVGWVGIRKSANGLACLNWWADRCLEWCFDKPEADRYADQGYLDQFPVLFEGVKVLKNKGFNLAPWNAHATVLTKVGGKPRLADTQEKLVFFHLHGLKNFGSRFITSDLNYFGKTHQSIIREVYTPYAGALRKFEKLVVDNGIPIGSTNKRGHGLRALAMRAQRSVFGLVSILIGNSFSVSSTYEGPKHGD